MITYRVYFRDGRGVILGRHEFEAEDDVAATRIAGALSEACSDMCKTFGLWDGARAVKTDARAGVDAAQISARTQRRVVETEMAIRDSDWSIARSRKLLDRLDRARVLDRQSAD
jgi:hypothetical protein